MTRSPFEGLTFLGFCRLLGVRLTPAQRVLCVVAFDGAEPADLPESDRDLARELFGSIETIPKAARAVLVAVCGARAGKSYVLCALYSLWRALVADLSSMAPGELGSALIASVDVRLGRVVLRYALGAARSSPALAPMVSAVTKDSFVLTRPDGQRVKIEVLPATRGGSSLRGRSLVSACLDECCFFRDGDTGAVNDADLFSAVSPRVLPGGIVVLASTPWVQAGLVFELFEANHGAPKTALACHAPTLLLNAAARNREAVERERQRDPDNCRREFGAEFLLAGSGMFFDRESLQAALSPDAQVTINRGAASAVAVGWDLALQRDSSSCVVLHQTGDHWTLAEAVTARPRKGRPLSLESVVSDFCAVTQRHGASQVRTDFHLLSEARRYAGSIALLPAPGGNVGKLSTYLNLRDALRLGKLRIPKALAWALEELAAVVATPLPGGGTALRSPRRAGSHGDTCSALVCAAWSAFGGAFSKLDDWDPIVKSARGSERGDIAPAGNIDSRVGSETGYLIDGTRFAVEDAGAIIETRPRPGHAGAGWPLM